MEDNVVNKNIKVERETFEKDGKTYFSYFIKCNIRGKDAKILISPPDLGGFAVLDIVFDTSMEADLVCNPYEIKNDKTGKVIKGVKYGVRTVDENGEIYECEIKPFRSSDKSLLAMLLK